VTIKREKCRTLC